MLDPDSTRHEDLRSGGSPWLAGPPRPDSAGLQADTRCDVVIVGGGAETPWFRHFAIDRPDPAAL